MAEEIAIRDAEGLERPLSNGDIGNRIYRAMQIAGVEDRFIADELAGVVVDYVSEECEEGFVIADDVEQMIENVLIQTGHAKTAKAYILYRDKKNQRRRQAEGHLVQLVRSPDDEKSIQIRKALMEVHLGTVGIYGPIRTEDFESVGDPVTILSGLCDYVLNDGIKYQSYVLERLFPKFQRVQMHSFGASVNLFLLPKATFIGGPSNFLMLIHMQFMKQFGLMG